MRNNKIKGGGDLEIDIWRKPVSTYAISACEALVASTVNSVTGYPESYSHEKTTTLVCGV